ncbi:MAG: aminotransferase class IV family protein [Arcobacteraceae bacterium]|jgi:4-amino-4-deoxychorismate lyase|nr:aminotransferase class IV family protein [Arcobacteraceae bacterium]
MKVFETIKCVERDIVNLDYHNERFNRTRQELFGCSDTLDIANYIKIPSKKLLKCKLVYADEIIDIDFSPYTKKDIKSLKLMSDDNIDYKYKYSNRDSINELYEQKGDFDDIIIVKNGFITDTSIANIAVFLDDKWLTPNKPLLEGTCRQRYIESGLLKTADITVEMLKNGKKIAILNAMRDFDILEGVKIG